MIALQELRLGNWIYDDDGILCRIIGFKPFDHSIRCDEQEGCLILIDIYRPDGTISEGWQCDSNTVKPIELTEDWLLKLGFEKKSNYQYTNKTFIIETWISRSKLDVRLRQSEETSVIICEITFVHQLQNLFFALTGEELTIKEQS